MATPTITGLNNELIGLLKTIPAFASNSFSVFNLDDLMQKTELQDFPIAAVAYNGSAPAGKPVTSVNETSPSATLIEHQFIIVIAVQYQYSGQEDTKVIATDLLDQIRNLVLGYRGINSRPWRWLGDNPEPDSSDNGTVLYSQVWHTTVPAIGSFNN